MAFNRKKQLFAPEVESLIKQLTGFEENEKNFQEVSRYFYQNVIHHNFATVDSSSVQRSLEGITEKLKIHGFGRRAKRLQELIERYVTSNPSEHSQLQWHVLLLLLRLSYKPLSVSEEALQPAQPALKPTEEQRDEDINWPEYLREGLEYFQCPAEDSDEWSEEDEGHGGEEECLMSPALAHTASPLPSYGDIPHPSLWQAHPQPLTQREVIRCVIRDGVNSEQWLRDHVQQPWWADVSYRSVPESTHPAANTCKLWEENMCNDSTLRRILQVFSEYKVLQELLWMLQAPSETSMFYLDDKGHYRVKSNISLPSTVPKTLQLYLGGLCSYFSMIHELREFEESLYDLEFSEHPAPFTFKAYWAELTRQLHDFKTTIVGIEERLIKQEETMTLLTVVEELLPGLNKLKYLYGVHTKATRGWRTEPPWLQVTRLLSVLYEAFLEAKDGTSLEACLSLFIHSFHVYLRIIDVWLSRGHLEDWRTEFFVTREGDRVQVMPYEEEMRKRGVVPVSLLTKLVQVVKDAGYTMEIVSQLNKLTELCYTVHNKGCLFKEFSENVENELNRLKGLMNQKSVLVEKSTTEVSEVDIEEKKPDNESQILVEATNGPLKDTTAEEVCGSTSAGDAAVKKSTQQLSKTSSSMSEGEECSRKPWNDFPPQRFPTISSKDLYEHTTKSLLSNPLLAEALRDYFLSHPEDPHPHQDSPQPPRNELALDNMSVVGVACLHRVLERQVELVESRHKLASRVVMKTLCEEYNLLQHFIVLRSVFFMESGTLAQRFHSYLFKEIEFGQLHNVNLTVHLQNAVGELFPQFHSCFAVHLNRSQAGDKVQQAIQALTIAYMVDWPVNMVISEDTIESYNKVFRFLLNIKYAFWVLQDVRFSELSSSPNTLRVRRLQVLRMWMYYSANTLHFYFMNLVLCHDSDQLDKAVQCASSIKDIIDAHKNYLIEVKTHCLQLNKSPLEMFIMKLVWQCQQLADLWMLEASGHLTDTEVTDLEQQYFSAYMGLTHCLEAIISDEYNQVNPLWQLKNEFLKSIPENWHYAGYQQ